jgi:hypothetical protein
MHRNGRTRATNSVGLYNITTTATSPLKYANVYRDMRTRSTNNTAISTGPYSKHSLHGTLIKPQHPLLQPSNRKTTASVPRPRRKSHLTGPQAKPAASPSPATPYLQKICIVSHHSHGSSCDWLRIMPRLPRRYTADGTTRLCRANRLSK